jgi:hypothetical protein
MESIARVLLMGLLWVSAASAVQFSVERSFERIAAMAGRSECRMEQEAEVASRAMAHRIARLSRVNWKSSAVIMPGTKS